MPARACSAERRPQAVQLLRDPNAKLLSFGAVRDFLWALPRQFCVRLRAAHTRWPPSLTLGAAQMPQAAPLPPALGRLLHSLRASADRAEESETAPPLPPLDTAPAESDLCAALQQKVAAAVGFKSPFAPRNSRALTWLEHGLLEAVHDFLKHREPQSAPDARVAPLSPAAQQCVGGVAVLESAFESQADRLALMALLSEVAPAALTLSLARSLLDAGLRARSRARGSSRGC
jgi:hypothetical protein